MPSRHFRIMGKSASSTNSNQIAVVGWPNEERERTLVTSQVLPSGIAFNAQAHVVSWVMSPLGT